jgi:hypothetical protein
VPSTALGSLAETCWLHHGRSHVARDVAVALHAAGPSADHATVPRRVAQAWRAGFVSFPWW